MLLYKIDTVVGGRHCSDSTSRRYEKPKRNEKLVSHHFRKLYSMLHALLGSAKSAISSKERRARVVKKSKQKCSMADGLSMDRELLLLRLQALKNFS